MSYSPSQPRARTGFVEALFGWWRPREIVIWSPMSPAEAAGALQASLATGLWSPPRTGFVRVRGRVDMTGFSLVPSAFGLGGSSSVRLTGHFIPANDGGSHLVGRLASPTFMKVISLIHLAILLFFAAPIFAVAGASGSGRALLAVLPCVAVFLLIGLLAQRQQNARFWMMHGLLRAHLSTVLRGVDVTPAQQAHVPS